MVRDHSSFQSVAQRRALGDLHKDRATCRNVRAHLLFLGIQTDLLVSTASAEVEDQTEVAEGHE